MAGRLYVTGGFCKDMSDVMTDVFIVDVENGALTRVPPMGFGRCAHATATTSTSLFVFGGKNETSLLSSCEEFNSQTMR